MVFEIRLDNLKFFSYHGLLPHEKEFGNDFIINLMVKVDIDEHELETDVISNTINYEEIFIIVDSIMKTPVNLLETVAWNIKKKIYEKWPQIKEGFIEIMKCRPPVKDMIGSAAVKLKF